MTTNKKLGAGVHRDLPMEVYHGDCCFDVSVSSTVLREVEDKSLRHGWIASHLNPRNEFNPAAHFALGTALHSLAFEGEISTKYFATSRYDNFRTKEAKEWRKRRYAEGRYIIGAADLDKVRGMLESLIETPLVQAGLFDENGEVECSIFHKDEETGLYLKVRPDVIPANGILVDLKSTTDARKRETVRAISKHNYPMQLALAAEVIEKECDIKINEHILAWVESSEPYCVAFDEIDPEYIGWARLQNRRAMRAFADCLAKGQGAEHFPKYDTDARIVYAPQWLEDRLKFEQEAGLLPRFIEGGYLGG